MCPVNRETKEDLIENLFEIIEMQDKKIMFLLSRLDKDQREYLCEYLNLTYHEPENYGWKEIQPNETT